MLLLFLAMIDVACGMCTTTLMWNCGWEERIAEDGPFQNNPLAEVGNIEGMALRGMCYPLTSTAHLKIRYAYPVPSPVAVQAEQCKTLKEA